MSDDREMHVNLLAFCWCVQQINEELTIFLFRDCLKASSDRSFCGNSFAVGITLDSMVINFKTGSGGFTSSAILATFENQKISWK